STREGEERADCKSPPLPGNEPGRWTQVSDAEAKAIVARIKALGSPAVSEFVTLPIQRGGIEAKFGIDLGPYFARIAGVEQPGSYLVGLRTTDGVKRQWMRVQVTDLTVSTVEEADSGRFVVTSLATAAPIAEAQGRVE